MRSHLLYISAAAIAFALPSDGAVFALTQHAQPSTLRESVLFSFSGPDGANPFAGLVFDAAGNLYGTTIAGGVNGYGTVYELSPGSGGQWAERVLQTFPYGAGSSFNPVTVDPAGNVFGSTPGGNTPGQRWGSVFELSPGSGGWTYRIVHSFVGPEGRIPFDGVVMDPSGNLYGTALQGGVYDAGTIFQLTRSSRNRWTVSTLYSFAFNAGGYGPYAGLIRDSSGDLFGVTQYGGSNACARGPSGGGCGVAFEYTASTRGELVLHRFERHGRTNGTNPITPLARDGAGVLYGTTTKGGAHGLGTIYSLAPLRGGDWKEHVLYDFAAGSDGDTPSGGPVLDPAGNLYGTTNAGGSPACGNSGSGCGVAYELVRAPGGTWTYVVLNRFVGPPDGQYPHGELILDASGNLYGTTIAGGANGLGTVFEITR